MKNKKLKDAVLIAGMVLPLLFAVVLRILTNPASDSVSITGPLIYFIIKMPLQDLPITESQVNSWAVLISITFLCLYLTEGLQARPERKRQVIAEWIVEKCDQLVKNNMGDFFRSFAPFAAAIMALSGFSSLLSLLGLFAPTSDLNIVLGWAILSFGLITHSKLRGGFGTYVKGFLEPTPVLLPINIIGELATPVSMSFRHYGNIMSGAVISVMVHAALNGLSKLVLGWLPGFLSTIPLFEVGLPAIMSIYFDVFSGVLQAFIFAMLTMLYVSGGFPREAYEARQAKKALKVKN